MSALVPKANISIICETSLPSTGAQKNAVLKSRHIDVVDSKIGPIERSLDGLERGWLVHLMYLSDIQYRLRPIDLLEILHDLEDRRFGAVEM
jgi:hypothetical protein